MLDCDFIPKAYHDRRRLRAMLRRRSACAAGMFGMMLLWIVAHHRQINTAEAMLCDVSQQRDQLALIAGKRAELERERSELKEQMRLIDRLANRASYVVVLAELSRSLPANVVLTEVAVHAPLMEPYLHAAGRNSAACDLPAPSTKDSAKPRSARPIEPEQLRISGVAIGPADVIEFAARVERSGLFDSVYMESLDATLWADRRVERFQLTCNVLPHEGRLP